MKTSLYLGLAVIPSSLAVDCSTTLVTVQTGSDSSCAGGNQHTWPTGYLPTQCHGWEAIDDSGKNHANSANNMRCNSDGSFSFTQFAGNLDCSGTGVDKTMTATCEQDIPPTLYSVLAGDDCGSFSGQPGVTQGDTENTIYLDGELCDAPSAAAAAAAAAAPLVNVQVFMESQCPACIDYSSSQLLNVKTLLGDIVDLEIFPYGNADEVQLDDGTYAFSCQHGSNECTSNMYEACAISHFSGDWWPFFLCMEESDAALNRDGPYDHSIPEACAASTASANVDWSVLQACVGSDAASGAPTDGNLIMHSIAAKTVASGKTFCPWVIVDGVVLTEEQIDNNDDLVAIVCRSYTGEVKPDACDGRTRHRGQLQAR
jgi:interferon gamma-inducible protein 30